MTMPSTACAPARPNDNQYPRPVIPDEPFNNAPNWFRSREPFKVAGAMALGLQKKVLQVHGILATGDGFECDCMPRRRNKAKREGGVAHPCPMPGKMPRKKGWPAKATINPHTLKAWHQDFPTANYALKTGADNGLWGLDIDGDEGFASLDALFPIIGPLPRTLVTISGSQKGAHYLFRLPEGVEVHNSANGIGPKIDVRAWHGQILLPGSMHKSGNRYAWAEGCAPGEAELAEAPPALLRLALEACRKTRSTAGPKRRTTRSAHKRPIASAPASTPPANTGVFGLIGDGPGRLGFHAAINKVACSYFATFGPAADSAPLKAVLIEAISNAPTIDREPNYSARYLDPARLDAAIESARAFILGSRKHYS